MTHARAAKRLFGITVALLVLYTLVSVIVGLKFLPGDLTQSSVPFDQVSGLAAALLDLLVVGGLLGGGIYAAMTPDEVRISGLLRFAVLLWSLLAILTLAAGILNLLSAGSAILAVLKVIVIVLVVAAIARNVRNWTPIPLVWTVGMVLSAVCALIGLMPTDDFMLATTLQPLASGVNTYIAYVLVGVALLFWLIVRFGGAPLLVDRRLNTAAGLLALAGALVTLSELGLNISWLGGLSAVFVPLPYLIFAAHVYRSLSGGNSSKSMAAHWMVLGVVLLVGGGLLGGAQAAIRLWTAGTRLSDLQPTLVLMAVVAILLGVIEQVDGERNGQDRSGIGLASFWLVAFGSIGGGLALAGAGLVQVYLERVLSIGYVEVQALIEPLYQLWILGLVLVALGVMLFAAGRIWNTKRPPIEILEKQDERNPA